MEDFATADSILEWMKEQATQKVPINPLRWLEAAMKLTILSSDEADKLIELESKVAELRAILLEQHGAAAKAKVHVESSPIFKELRTQQSKCKRIEEMVRLSKKFAQLKSDELRNNL